jgi:CheY-like chemotaxis protein
LVLLDLAMPVMSGRAFLEARRADPDLARIPVVVYSAYGSGELHGVCGFVRKDEDPNTLLALIERCRRRELLTA